MKRIIYILIMIMAVAGFNSCETDLRDVDMIKDGPNLVVFKNPSQTVTQIAETGEWPTEVQIKITGPTTYNLDGDIKVTFEVDKEASTAIEGTHYRLDEPTILLKKENNYLGLLTFIQLTDGIETPLEELPVLVLKVAKVEGGGNIIPSGKTTAITLSYACPSNLAGTYQVHTVYTAYDGTVYELDWTEDITETGIGEYRTTYVGHWGDLGVGTPGYTFYDVCGEITVPGQNLVDYYANWVQGTKKGSVADDGTITIEYSICYPQGSDNCRYYVSIYTPYTPVD
jgi:hypothetical protein